MKKEWIYPTIIIAAVLAILGLLFSPVILLRNRPISSLETRIYLSVFLIVLSVMTFGILRIYNAIVANTRYTMKLQAGLKLNETATVANSRTISQQAKLIGQKMDSHERAVADFKGTVQELIKILASPK